MILFFQLAKLDLKLATDELARLDRLIIDFDNDALLSLQFSLSWRQAVTSWGCGSTVLILWMLNFFAFIFDILQSSLNLFLDFSSLSTSLNLSKDN